MICFLALRGAWAALVLVWLVGAAYAKPQQRATGPLARTASFAAILLGFFLVGSDWGPAWLSGPPLLGRPWAPCAGAALTVLGCAFAIWARLALGSNWSGRPTVKVNHELVMEGPYALTRHPIYSGILLAAIGTALADLEWRRVIGIGILMLSLLWKIRQEERLMAETFPGSYPAYRRRVKRLVPGIF